MKKVITKVITKATVFILLAVMLVCLFALVPAFAEATGAETSAETVETVETSEASAESVETAEATGEPSEKADRESWGAWLLGVCKKYLAEIMSGVAVIMTTVLAAISKKVLLPTLANGLGRISAATQSGVKDASELVKKAGTALDDISGKLDESLNGIAEKVDGALIAAGEAAGVASKYAEEIKTLQVQANNAENDRSVLKAVMQMQSDTFNSIVQCSSLPQWRKDEFAKDYAKQSEAIASLIKASEAGEENGI